MTEQLKEPDHQVVEAVVAILMNSALPRTRTMSMPCESIVLVVVVEEEPSYCRPDLSLY
jgi:hypothetical protein